MFSLITNSIRSKKIKHSNLLCFFIFILSCSPSFSQVQNQIKIPWKAPILILTENGEENEVLYFENAKYKNNIPFFSLRIFNEKVEKLQFKDLNFSPLDSFEIKLVPQNFSESEIAPSVEVKFQGGKPISVIYFPALRRNSKTGILEKLISFTYTYTSASNTNFSFATSNARISSTSVEESALSSGDWYKLRISNSGIFKIDYNFLVSIGLDPLTIDPRKIQIFGNGGGVLPQPNSISRKEDLVENAIFVQGESDSVFNQNDYVLFYGKGPHDWIFDTNENSFKHIYNLYSENAYYFLKIGSNNGQRIFEVLNESPSNFVISDYNERIFHEKDLINKINSGREWFGETFENVLTQDFYFNTTGVIPNSNVEVTSAVMGHSDKESRFVVSVDGQKISEHVFYLYDVGTYTYKGDKSQLTGIINSSLLANKDSLKVNLNYLKGSGKFALGYLNYLEVKFLKDLKYYGNPTFFRSLKSLDNISSDFIIKEVKNDCQIWDVTNPHGCKKHQFSLSGNNAIFTTSTTSLKEFVAFSLSDSFPSPVFENKVANQNLHGSLAGSIPQLVIVCDEKLLTSANKLAEHRRSFNKFQVKVVTTKEIYNEFSSGAQDVSAIRDYLRMLYVRSTSSDSLKYALLFGAASFDYKSRIPNNVNLVPVYESYESLHPVNTFSSDDYYGLLDENEGEWSEFFGSEDYMDIGIGRLPIRNETEGLAIVNKIINYETNPACFGKWRNDITFVADDGDNNLHQNHAEVLSDSVLKFDGNINIKKLYVDGFPQESTPTGQTVAELRKQLTETFNKGSLIINYSGHGGDRGLASENVVDINLINSLKNINNLPFLVTATCEFGRYDDPTRPSAAMFSLTNKAGGSVGLLSSTRPVYASSNFAINKAFFQNVFKQANGSSQLLGDIIKKTKNGSLLGINNRNYSLLADPCLALAFPKKEVKIREFINTPANDTAQVVQALTKVTFIGEILSDGAKDINFNGKVSVSLYDKESIYSTYGLEHQTFPMQYTARINILFYGKAQVNKGEFKVSFTIPKDINYLTGKGKISFYAWDSLLTDAKGEYSDIIVGGGIDPSASREDTTSPNIKLYMDHENFLDGGTTLSNTQLIAKLSDENGINTSQALFGHEIVGSLDNGKPFILNDYYYINDSLGGTVKFNFRNLSLGKHQLKVKAWDNFNNSGESTITFHVAQILENVAQSINKEDSVNFLVDGKSEFIEKKVLCIPNPLKDNTTIYFEHSFEGGEASFEIPIYDINGGIIRTIKGSFDSIKSSVQINWDGRDGSGNKVSDGIYLFKIILRSFDGFVEIYPFQKILVLK